MKTGNKEKDIDSGAFEREILFLNALFSSDPKYYRPKTKTIYVVDDEKAICLLLKRFLRKQGYRVNTFESPLDLIDTITDPEKLPDLIITDIMMPEMTGVDLAKAIRSHSEDVPIMAITGHMDSSLYKGLFENGFCDMVEKPFILELLLSRIKRVLETAQIPNYKKVMDTLVLAIANMGDARDVLTQNHNVRIGEISYILACEMGLSEEITQAIRLAARMHDIGKLSVPDTILQKKGRLTEEEFKQVKTHATAGAKMLESLKMVLATDYIDMAYEIVLMHHEKLDGSGYPAQLKAHEIPLHVRIATVADIYDAVTMSRPYHGAQTHEEAIRILQGEASAGKLDRNVIKALIASEKEIKEVKAQFPESAGVKSKTIRKVLTIDAKGDIRHLSA
jgi:putative two-component system response regulator